MAADSPIRSCKICILFVILLVMATATILTSAESNSRNVRHHLKRLNKPPVKTIKSPDGDIIDCVDIAHQPAFDHALVKNHTIQMRPSFRPEGVVSGESDAVSAVKESRSVSQLWHLNGRCQEGTIPIRRTKRNDILRASSIERFGKKNKESSPTNPRLRPTQPGQNYSNGHEYAAVYEEGGTYFGAKARINVWRPEIQQDNEFSLAQIWIVSGTSGADIETVEVGWLVFLFINFISISLLSIIFHLCIFIFLSYSKYIKQTGFVQTNSKVALGATIYPLSGYGGSQYDITPLVWKDPGDGNWWLQIGDQVLGYWPFSLFSHLKDSATMIEWGGEIVDSKTSGQHTATGMGSGHFPREGFGKASYFRNIQIVDGFNKLMEPAQLATFTSQSSCYDIRTDHGRAWKTYFYYGGPGRSPSCP
ncbi:hypothetical protein SADUNF_Sadunf16G0215800 [Salix dunnii]|uniref:Neprosin PEP catalytic domain-containing protein n=1 Tax=Salix dunnii TaxID=1413687 RepID=A0A835MHM1_9ROSI|nr:hypothetical protein SADUNF_Sadunf16G0215800 [Salix dunnii]